MKRRAFLATSAALTVTFLAGCALPVIPKRPSPTPNAAMGWVRREGGRYVVWLPRAEMGQNIMTALKQIACEELDVEWAALDIKLPSTRDIDRVRATVGSESVKDFAVPLAQACATLRDAVSTGQREGVMEARVRPVEQLRAFAANPRWVGKAVPLEQSQEIVRGLPLFVADIRRPNMVFGRVLRAPISPELASHPLSWNEAAARAQAGFVMLIAPNEKLRLGQSQGLGLVAETPGALDRIEAALAVRWQQAGAFEQSDLDRAIDIDARVRSGGLANRIHNDAIDTSGKWDVDLRIDTPLAAHAPIEPRAAVAEPDAAGGMQVWVGSQDAFYQRDVIVKALGLAEEKVIVHAQRIGGGFGGKTICTVELEAAALAHAVQRAVKVQWTRAQEFTLGFHRPPSSHRVRARVRDGTLETWWHAFCSSHILFTNAIVPPWLQRLTNVIGDNGVARGAALAYRAKAKRTEFDLVRLPVFTGPWRGLGAGPNHLATESAIDECAVIAKMDPLEFRLNNAIDPRLQNVLRKAAESARWSEAKPARVEAALAGRGIACGIYKEMSYAAVVAEIEIDPTSGSVAVRKLFCAHDCGRVINPDQVRAQCEGNLVWGLSMVLFDSLPVTKSTVADTFVRGAQIPRLPDVPAMQIELLDDSHAPSGAGETAIVAAAAIANAVRAAIGVRLTQFPLRPQAVFAALQQRR